MQAFEPHSLLVTNSLKRRSRSTSPQPHKRRLPPSYVPGIYADLPPALPRSFSTEAVAGTPFGGSASGRSTPSTNGTSDWLQRTRELHLQTPELQTPGTEDEVLMDGEDAGMVGSGGEMQQHDHVMEDDPPFPYSPHPAVPLSTHASASPFPPPPSPQDALPPPHDAPPLHQHLAGSPQPLYYPTDSAEGMTRSASDQSVQSMRSAEDGAAGGMDTEPHEHQQGGSPRKSGPGRGGWRVTMGFRADCDRCARREQGHYTHVVWSS